MSSVSLPDEVRASCAWVAGRARFVRIDEGAIEAYAAGPTATGEPREPPNAGNPEAAAAFAICMNAINFGSGWWPTIRKRPGHSGYATMAAGVEERFAEVGPWTAGELAGTDAEAIAAVVGQDPEHPLMVQFAAALRDVGEHLRADHGGRYLGVAESADSIPALAGVLGGWNSFADASEYEGRRVAFFKRAQLAAADLHRAGVADLPGIERLTAFADNLVPQVLRVDGVLQLDPGLTAGIETDELLVHGSPEEVELRACAVHAIELLAATSNLAPAEIDSTLWNRGRDPRYKSPPSAPLAEHRLLTRDVLARVFSTRGPRTPCERNPRRCPRAKARATCCPNPHSRGHAGALPLVRRLGSGRSESRTCD